MTQSGLWVPEGALCSVQPAGSGGAGAGGRAGKSAMLENREAQKSQSDHLESSNWEMMQSW